MNWDKVKIKSTTPYRSNYNAVGKNRCIVVLDIPMDEYSNFRKIVETSHLKKLNKKYKSTK